MASFSKIEVAQAAAKDSLKNVNDVLAQSNYTLAVSSELNVAASTSSVEDFKLIGRLGK